MECERRCDGENEERNETKNEHSTVATVHHVLTVVPFRTLPADVVVLAECPLFLLIKKLQASTTVFPWFGIVNSEMVCVLQILQIAGFDL